MTATREPDSTAALVEQLVDLTDARARLDERIDAIKAQLRNLGPGTFEAGAHRLVISAQRRFDPILAREVLDESVYASLCTAFDARKAREVLAPALFEACMRDSGEPRVTVR